MKKHYLTGAAAFLLFATSCQKTDLDNTVINQQFVHRYGFDVTEEEWDQRPEDGKVISTLGNGVKISQTYENGELHGSTTYSFPNSSTIEKLLVYDQGTLLKETHFDLKGMPVKEELFEFDERRVITHWDTKGVPLSIEEYDGELLVEGKYFTKDHELEAKVEQAIGTRIQRDREGLLLTKDLIEEGILKERTTYHPNGQVQTVSHYQDYQLHGPQLKFTSLGRPLMELNWSHGILDGVKTTYRNGIKISEIPYVDGVKHGIENHYDDLGNLTAEIPWRNDRKHGLAKTYTEDSEESRWFFNGKTVTLAKFELLETREQMIAEFHGIDLNIDDGEIE